MFDKIEGGDDTAIEGSNPMPDQAVGAIRLKREQTQPSDFLHTINRAVGDHPAIYAGFGERWQARPGFARQGSEPLRITLRIRRVVLA